MPFIMQMRLSDGPGGGVVVAAVVRDGVGSCSSSVTSTPSLVQVSFYYPRAALCLTDAFRG